MMESSGTGDAPAPDDPPAAGQSPLVSVIVNNYNYERYVGQAIDSALGQTYPHVEVIVVDDGSKDGSRAVIEGYGDRVVAVLKDNGGQGSAFNVGFARSSGSIVVFLDSDDFLFPEAVQRVVAEYDSRMAKTQFRLTVVDAENRPTGEYPPPDIPLHRGDVVPILLERGYYATAVASGNAYSRWALEGVLPVPEDDFRYGADGYVNAVVPFQGPVHAIDVTLAAYRAHGGNFSVMAGDIRVELFHYTITHELAVERVLLEAAKKTGRSVRGGLMLRYPGHVEARLASLRIDPTRHLIPGDKRLALAWRGIVATWRYADMSTLRRALDTGWFVAVAILPLDLARHVIAWKYARAARPRVIRWLVRLVRRVTG
jgi:glycosyltransferase involved in cell wall biosynthesis